MLLTQAVARSKLKMKCRREKVMPKEKYVRVYLRANVNLLLAATLDLNSLSNAKCKRLNFQKEKIVHYATFFFSKCFYAFQVS